MPQENTKAPQELHWPVRIADVDDPGHRAALSRCAATVMICSAVLGMSFFSLALVSVA
jgi:hypothetical protein